MDLLRTCVIGGLLACAYVLGASAQDGSEDGASEDRFLVPLEDISTQDEDPYHFDGIEVTSDHGRWSEYRREIRKFPSALDCVPQQSSELIDLSTLDLRRVRGPQATEVCLFRIFASLSDVGLVEDWLTSNSVSGVYRAEIRRLTNRYDQYVGGNWKFDDLREHTRVVTGLINTPIQALVRADAYVQVHFLGDDKVAGVSISARLK